MQARRVLVFARESRAGTRLDKVAVRWCSDGFEIGCDTKEEVRVALPTTTVTLKQTPMSPPPRSSRAMQGLVITALENLLNHPMAHFDLERSHHRASLRFGDSAPSAPDRLRTSHASGTCRLADITVNDETWMSAR